MFLVLLMAGLAFSQNAQLSGIVTDPSGGLVPGVTITATNTETGVASYHDHERVGGIHFPKPSTRESL